MRDFTFLNPGPLIDGELELVEPEERWIESYLAMCRRPESLVDDPELEHVSRVSLHDFLRESPHGRVAPDDSRGLVPQYTFWMRLRFGGPVLFAGRISLRVSSRLDMEMYYGQIGYAVFPAARGHHYSERACRLLMPLAARHGLRDLWITCNPDNLPSRKTCEHLGGQFVEIVDVPRDNPLYRRGEKRKCRYRIPLVSVG